MSKPLDERKKILAESMKEIPGRIMMSESTRVTKHDELRDLMLVCNFSMYNLIQFFFFINSIVYIL
jgi:hypothetical protein